MVDYVQAPLVKTDNWLQEETIGLEPYSLTLNVEFRHKKGAFQAKMASNFKFVNRAHKPACAKTPRKAYTHRSEECEECVEQRACKLICV